MSETDAGERDQGPYGRYQILLRAEHLEILDRMASTIPGCPNRSAGMRLALEYATVCMDHDVLSTRELRRLLSGTKTETRMGGGK